ncbi:MAG TPA: hypothetical protein VMI54_27150 [Polyangiaceae bacterium]|nr:hypothetical protein [Polyangiaceae bacterium]
MVEVSEGAKGSVIVDDRYSPLVVSTFTGEVELEQGRWYERVILEIIARSVSEGRRVASVHDTSGVTRTTAEMRQFWAEMSSRNGNTLESRTLANLVVVTNPLMRGVLTAVGWMNPKVASLRLFPSLDAAVTEALKLLRDAGTPVTLPAGGYRTPRSASIRPR